MSTISKSNGDCVEQTLESAQQLEQIDFSGDSRDAECLSMPAADVLTGHGKDTFETVIKKQLDLDEAAMAQNGAWDKFLLHFLEKLTNSTNSHK